MIAGRDWSDVQVVGVSRLANYLKRKLEADAKLMAIGVEGEVSNLRVQSSGSWNFSLKDRDAVIDCFAFPSDAATFPEIRNGAAITAYGRVSTFERKSSYQLVVRHCELAGIGKLYARYEELRRRLDAEGLFRDDRKRPLPRYPFRVALVGSPSGEGTRDFLTQARARAPQVAITLVETPVQGDVAPQIVAALRRACVSKPDLVVLARGGGSFEDLFVFSDERVVRAVAECPVPIVTAIGHEADAPLADFAADKRASTPSTAAQTVLPRRDDLRRELARDLDRMRRALEGRLRHARRDLERIEYRSPLADPRMLLAARRQRLDALADALQRRSPIELLKRRRDRLRELAARLTDPQHRLTVLRGKVQEHERRLTAAAQRVLERKRHRFVVLSAGLNGLNPTAPLERGFAIVRRDGAVVRDAAEAPPGTALRLQLARGELAARVESSSPDAGEQIGLF